MKKKKIKNKLKKMINLKKYVNISCGHMCVCKDCAEKLNRICPLCKRVGNFIRVFE